MVVNPPAAAKPDAMNWRLLLITTSSSVPVHAGMHPALAQHAIGLGESALALQAVLHHFENAALLDDSAHERAVGLEGRAL